MAYITNKLNSNTGENIQAVVVTEWAPPGTTPVILNSTNETTYLGGLYNKEGNTYFKWQVAGGFPVSRLTALTENNFKKLVADFGNAPAIIILDKIIPVTQTIVLPANIKIEYINGAYFDTPVSPVTANVYVDEQSNTEVTLEQFGGVGDGEVYNGVGSMTAGTAGGNDPYLLTVTESIFSPEDVGKRICVHDADAYAESSSVYQSGLSTVITQFISVTQVKLQAMTDYAVSNVRISFGTDNTNAFYRYNRWARNKEGMVTLNLQKDKKYIHRTIRWGYNVMNQTVNGNGATLLNVATAWMDRGSLTTAATLNGETTDGLDNSSTLVKYIINTVEKNSTTLQLSSTTDASAFVVGEWIMVASDLINFGGFPPNYRYFDYVKISDIDTTAGLITIDRALKYTHKSDSLWIKDSGDVSGIQKGACIYRLETGSKFGITHIYNDMSFICETRRDYTVATDPVRARGLYIEFNRCTFDNIVPSVAETVVTNNCTQKGWISEFDKLVTNFRDNGSNWKHITGGNSITRAVFNNAKFDSIEGLSCRNIAMNNCSKMGTNTSVSFSLGLRGGGTKSLIIDGGIYNQAPQQTRLIGQIPRVQLGTGSVSYTASTAALVVPTTSTNINFLVNLTVGCRIDVMSEFASQGGTANNTGTFGTVKAISSDGINTTITVAFNNILGGTEILGYYWEPDFVSIKNTTIAGTYIKEQKYVSISPEIKKESLTISPNHNEYVNPLGGSPVKIIVNVKKAYTGSSTDALLKVTGEYPDPAQSPSITIDLTKKGIREINTVMNIGKMGNDILPDVLKLSSGYFKSVYRLRCTSLLSGAATDLPVVDIYIQNHTDALESTVAPIGIETAADGTNNNTPASTAFVVKNSGRVIQVNTNPTATVTASYLNTTYPVATYPIGTQLRFFNLGKVYCRETSTVWSESVIALTT